jgi:ribosome-binding factor A
MPENRNAEHHRERLMDALREEIDSLIGGELNDPRIGLCHVTEVVMAPGGKSARILVDVDGGEKEAVDTLAGLTAARGFIRTEVRDRLGKRHVPELTFHIDRSEKTKERIDELLGRVQKRAKKQQQKQSSGE